MARVQLKRLIGRKKEAATIVNNFIEAAHMNVAVKDEAGQLLLGREPESSAGQYAVELDGETLGWVVGDQQAAAVAALLIHLARQELEKKELAGEVLANYRELNLLYNISEKVAATLDLAAVAQLVIDEAGRLIKAGEGAVMLLDEQQHTLKAISTIGQAYQPNTMVPFGQGVIGSIADTGKAEVVNHVLSDSRFIDSYDKMKSLVCAPLKAKQKVIGLIFIGTQNPVIYTAADLKLLNTIASQAAPAIESALLFERELKAAKAREERLQQQIAALRIELDEAKQEQQVAEITETDYFRDLQSKASNLRAIMTGGSK